MITVPVGQLNPSVSVTIPISTQTSGTINQNGMALSGIYFPSAMTGTVVSFLASGDGVTFYPMINSAGAALSYTLATSSYMALDSTLFQGVEYLQIKSGTTEVAARTLICSLKGKS